MLIDFGAAREVLNKQASFIRPMYTPGFAAPEMYKRDNNLGPWTDIYAIGACMFACMTGQPPTDVPNRRDKDRLAMALARLRGVYSDNLLELVQSAMALDPMERPQSVFAFHKALINEPPRSYTPLSVAEKVRLQLESLMGDTSRAQAAQAAQEAARARAS